MKHHTIGFIGAGNMARSLAGGLLNNAWSRDKLILSDPSPEQRAAVSDALGLTVLEKNADVAARADVLVLAVKPQILRATAQALAATVQTKKPLVVSIAAGIRADDIQRWLGGNLAVVPAGGAVPPQRQS